MHKGTILHITELIQLIPKPIAKKIPPLDLRNIIALNIAKNKYNAGFNND